MDKSEPTFVPEWLKNAGSSNTSGSTYHADDRETSRITINKSLVNSYGHDDERFNSDMTTSSYIRRNSNGNGSGHMRPYASFGRNKRNKEWGKDTHDSRDKGKIGLGNRKHGDYSDQLGSTFSNTFERDGLRRSQSMISGKRETWHKKSAAELITASGNNNNDLHIRRTPVHEVKKESFVRDLLGAEEKAIASEGVRIPSPGLSSTIQKLPIGNSLVINGEKWTSALAEVPVIIGSNGSAFSSTPSSTSVVLNTTTGLNMAKTVAQGPCHTQTTPQLSAGTQRFEELSIKQSKQLIPVAPTFPKTLVVNTSDKHKTKLAQHHPSASSPLSVTHSPRGGPLNGDVSKGMNSGRLHVLKPVREKNGVVPVLKDTSSPTNGSKVASSTVTSITRGPLNNPVIDRFDRKPVLTVLEKRPSSQARSRNDFFNQVRKKSMANSSCGTDSAIISNSSVHVPDKHIETPFSKCPTGDHLSEGSDQMTCNGSDGHVQDEARDACNGWFSEEEEAAFLRSMGWEENADEDGLTEEEIYEFYRDASKYVNLKPSLKILEGVRSKIRGIADGVSSGVSSSDAKLES